MNYLIFPIINTIFCIVLLIFCKKITRSLSFVLLITIGLSTLCFSKNIYNLLINIAILSLIIFFYKKISDNFKYDFSGKILSLRSIFNFIMIHPNPIKDNRIIGKVIPYNNYQLKYNGRYITANETATAGSTLISGSTGSGKTYGIESLIRQDLFRGNSVIFCDYKGDLKVVNRICKYAKRLGYLIFRLDSESCDFNYDPLQNINNVGRIEAIVNMRKWSVDGADNHYKIGLQILLQKLIGEFTHIYNEKGYKNYTYEFYKYVENYRYERDEYDSYITCKKLLELLINGGLSSMFKFKFDKTLNFEELINKKFLIIASFISSNKELATSFSSLFFKDLLDTFTNSPSDKNICLYEDEFATLENPFIIKDLAEKGRSAKLANTLVLQDINQIVIKTNEAYLDSLLGTINNFIIYNGATRNTAERLAGVQLYDIEDIIMNLKKPLNGKPPTALYISKYPSLNRKNNSEVFRFEPFIWDKNSNFSKNNIKENNPNIEIKNSLNKTDLYKNTDIEKDSNTNVEREDLEKIDYSDFI